MNYYNEFDSKAAKWLRNLIAAGLIPAGEVDDRSIIEVMPNDLRGFTQCHFFAGIGGWPLALQLAGVPADRPLWTGSCPCQPFSVAGKRKGTDDERHLWPEFNRLITECAPPIVFGEQVASKDGRLWLAGVRADLEILGYAVGGADLCAAGIEAPHIRQRLYWVADGNEQSSGQGRAQHGGRDTGSDAESWAGPGVGSDVSGLSDATGARPFPSAHAGIYCSEEGAGARNGEPERCGNAFSWGDSWIACADGKARRIEPGLSPLAHGIPARVVRLRGYGNAIVPPLAAEFIAAFFEVAA